MFSWRRGDSFVETKVFGHIKKNVRVLFNMNKRVKPGNQGTG